MEKLQSRKELANLLGVPVQTLANWASSGKGPAYMIVGRHARYALTDVRAWLAEQRRGGEAS